MQEREDRPSRTGGRVVFVLAGVSRGIGAHDRMQGDKEQYVKLRGRGVWLASAKALARTSAAWAAEASNCCECTACRVVAEARRDLMQRVCEQL